MSAFTVTVPESDEQPLNIFAILVTEAGITGAEVRLEQPPKQPPIISTEEGNTGAVSSL